MIGRLPDNAGRVVRPRPAPIVGKHVWAAERAMAIAVAHLALACGRIQVQGLCMARLPPLLLLNGEPRPLSSRLLSPDERTTTLDSSSDRSDNLAT